MQSIRIGSIEFYIYLDSTDLPPRTPLLFTYAKSDAKHDFFRTNTM